MVESALLAMTWRRFDHLNIRGRALSNPVMHMAAVMTLFFTVVGYAAAAAEPARHVEAFSMLQDGDMLIVHYQSRGCFHGFTREFTFTKGANLTVSIVALRRVVIMGKRRWSRCRGSLWMTKEDW